MSVFDHWELILRQVIVANSLFIWVHGSWSALIMAVLSWLVFVSLWKRNHHRTKCNLILLEPQIATDHCQDVIIIFIKMFYILYFILSIFLPERESLCIGEQSRQCWDGCNGQTVKGSYLTCICICICICI